MNKQRILIVDDDRSIVKVVRSYLEQAGYKVHVVHDGETALHFLREVNTTTALRPSCVALV